MSVVAQIDLHPVTVSTAPVRRLAQFVPGVALFGASMAMMTRAGLGLAPWDVLHDGFTKRTGLSFGVITAIASVIVLALWIPLRQRPGIGTALNVIIISVTVDLVRAVLPDQRELAWQVVLLVGGVVLNAVATATYVGTRLGAGPRDVFRLILPSSPISFASLPLRLADRPSGATADRGSSGRAVPEP